MIYIFSPWPAIQRSKKDMYIQNLTNSTECDRKIFTTLHSSRIIQYTGILRLTRRALITKEIYTAVYH